MASLLFVCLGNICRSPMAEAIAASLAVEQGWRDLRVDSAGTSRWHVGEPPDPGTLAVLQQHGQSRAMRARTFTPEDARRFDLVLAMDRANLQAMQAVWPDDATATLDLVLKPLGLLDVADPWGRGIEAFEAIHTQLTEAIPHWLAHPALRGGA